jgi:TolB-like protein
VIVGPAMTKRFGSRTPIDSIHTVLGAAYAISGVVRRRANGVDIFAQYVRAKDGGHVWGFRVLDSAAHRDAEIGARIADSVAAIVLNPTPRAARGFERPVKPR